MTTTKHPRWQPFLSTLSQKGRKELTFPGVPEEIDSEDLIVLVRKWINDELVSHDIICDYTIHKDYTVEIWCTTREILDDDFGEPLKIWDDPLFITHLSQSFADVINEALSAGH